MASKQHAILSASGADRWIHCPPSARLCETYEDKGSDYAAEGTDAHALGEFKIKKYGDTFIKAIKKYTGKSYRMNFLKGNTKILPM